MGLFEDDCPKSLLLALPLGAILEEVLPSLNLALTPPAGGVRLAGGPPEILAAVR